MERERIAILEENSRWQNKILEEIRSDVQEIKKWRWKLFGVNAAITTMISAVAWVISIVMGGK